ncbi:unnamed protein product [Moneuplotes crassus]|uniref:Uncharacterized protein n=1 Tax=Euplotes crassus TaxID=5936 RepID=A0AAD1UCG0_EUPCR|nr:unnamed protein product [Moneuplotes crassus]
MKDQQKLLVAKREQALVQFKKKQQEDRIIFELAFSLVFDDMIKTFTRDLAQRCIYDEKKLQRKESNIAAHHERDFILYFTIKDMLQEISQDSISEVTQKISSERLIRHDMDFRSYQSDLKSITDQGYCISPEQSKVSPDFNEKVLNSFEIPKTFERSCEESTHKNSIIEHIHGTVFTKVLMEMTQDVTTKTYGGIKRGIESRMNHSIYTQITNNLVESELNKLVAELSYECINKAKAENKLASLEVLLGRNSFSYECAYYINGLRKDNPDIIKDISSLSIPEKVQELTAAYQERLIKETTLRMITGVARDCLRGAKISKFSINIQYEGSPESKISLVSPSCRISEFKEAEYQAADISKVQQTMEDTGFSPFKESRARRVYHKILEKIFSSCIR